MSEILLLNVTGKDRTGLVARITGVLAEHGVNVLDIGQAVIHDYISLGILVEIPDERSPRQCSRICSSPATTWGWTCASAPPLGRIRKLGARAGQGTPHHHAAGAQAHQRTDFPGGGRLRRTWPQHRRDHAAHRTHVPARPSRRAQTVHPTGHQRLPGRRTASARPALADRRRHAASTSPFMPTTSTAATGGWWPSTWIRRWSSAR